MAGLNQIKPAQGATKKRKRIGRGDGSGHGTTAGKGTKGQLARSGGGKGPGFEGGRMSIIRKIPHLPGFKNIFKIKYQVVSLGRLSQFKNNEKVGPEALFKAGIIKKIKEPIKILSDGKLEKSLIVRAHAFSKKAEKLIKKAGGKTEIIKR